MIAQRIRGNVYKADQKHIVFGINTEGYNDAGFAGQVARKVNPKLANTGGNQLGEALSFEGDNKTFHAVVCHSLSENPGWSKTPEVIEKALNELDTPEGEPIAVVLMGGGMIGQMMGADVDANLKAMERSSKEVYVYPL
jgi:hypothetical protein